MRRRLEGYSEQRELADPEIIITAVRAVPAATSVKPPTSEHVNKMPNKHCPFGYSFLQVSQKLKHCEIDFTSATHNIKGQQYA